MRKTLDLQNLIVLHLSFQFVAGASTNRSVSVANGTQNMDQLSHLAKLMKFEFSPSSYPKVRCIILVYVYSKLVVYGNFAFMFLLSF